MKLLTINSFYRAAIYLNILVGIGLFGYFALSYFREDPLGFDDTVWMILLGLVITGVSVFSYRRAMQSFKPTALEHMMHIINAIFFVFVVPLGIIGLEHCFVLFRAAPVECQSNIFLQVMTLMGMGVLSAASPMAIVLFALWVGVIVTMLVSKDVVQEP